MQPSVANASDRCNDATQRCKHISQLQFPADILPTFDFPPPKTSLLEGGGPPQRWKEFAHRAPADIPLTLAFPIQRPPSSREGDRPQAVEGVIRRWKELSGGGRSSRRKAFNPIFEHKDCKKTDGLLYYNVRSGLPSAVPAPIHHLKGRGSVKKRTPLIFGHPRRVRPDFC